MCHVCDINYILLGSVLHHQDILMVNQICNIMISSNTGLISWTTKTLEYFCCSLQHQYIFIVNMEYFYAHDFGGLLPILEYFEWSSKLVVHLCGFHCYKGIFQWLNSPLSHFLIGLLIPIKITFELTLVENLW